MKRVSILYFSLAVAGVLVGAWALAVWSPLPPAFAQPAPVPQECSCSRAVNLATSGPAVDIRHCQCGILSCAVVVSSGQLQCTR